MGFFDNLGKKASAAYDATAEKTGKIAKEAKFKMKINENKSDINNIYKEIGRKVYEKHVREENIDIKTELEEECTKIDVLSAEIETCLKSILELKEKKQCEQCHAEIDLDDVFCSKCGAKQPETEVKEAEVVNAETVKEDLENAEIKPENENEKIIVEEEVSGTSEDSVNVENTVNSENSVGATSENAVNNLEKVTEIMSVETQEEAKETNNQENE